MGWHEYPWVLAQGSEKRGRAAALPTDHDEIWFEVRPPMFTLRPLHQAPFHVCLGCHRMIRLTTAFTGWSRGRRCAAMLYVRRGRAW